MLAEYRDSILEARKKGMTYREIAKMLEDEYGYIVTHQAINKYMKKLDLADEKELPEEVINLIVGEKSARSAHLELKKLGYSLSYKKVREIRNVNKK